MSQKYHVEIDSSQIQKLDKEDLSLISKVIYKPVVSVFDSTKDEVSEYGTNADYEGIASCLNPLIEKLEKQHGYKRAHRLQFIAEIENHEVAKEFVLRLRRDRVSYNHDFMLAA